MARAPQGSGSFLTMSNSEARWMWYVYSKNAIGKFVLAQKNYFGPSPLLTETDSMLASRGDRPRTETFAGEGSSS
jgi:hypothetical protein